MSRRCPQQPEKCRAHLHLECFKCGRTYYFACIIADATACCAQGIEFVLKDERKFPDEYPSKGTEITVVGIFDIYKEGTYQYCQLIDAVME